MKRIYTEAEIFEAVCWAVGDDGNTAYFRTCAAGLTRQAATFCTSGVIGDGNDSTDVDFPHYALAILLIICC